MCRVRGEELQHEGRPAEPGDALLIDGNGENVHLQLGEVVDIRRIRTNLARKGYGTALWKDRELQEIYSGVQVAITDDGEAIDLPKLSSPAGGEISAEITEAFRSLKEVAESLPMNLVREGKGKKTGVTITAFTMTLWIRLLRYGKPDGTPPKWLWTGSVRVRGDESLLSFKDAIAYKSVHYARIKDPFWLLLYSLDLGCDDYEQAVLAGGLAQTDHPFDRVAVFLPRAKGGDLRELFPSPGDLPDLSQVQQKKMLFRFLPEDAIPKWDDPRWTIAAGV